MADNARFSIGENEMRFAIEDTTDIDRPEFHHAPTFAAAIRLADELHETRTGAPDRIIDLKTRETIATITPSWNRCDMNILICDRTRGRLSDIAAKIVRDSVGPRYQQID